MKIPKYLYNKLNGVEVTIYNSKRKVKLNIPKKTYNISLYGNMLVINHESNSINEFYCDIYTIPNSIIKYINRTLIINDLND